MVAVITLLASSALLSILAYVTNELLALGIGIGGDCGSVIEMKLYEIAVILLKTKHDK